MHNVIKDFLRVSYLYNMKNYDAISISKIAITYLVNDIITNILITSSPKRTTISYHINLFK